MKNVILHPGTGITYDVLKKDIDATGDDGEKKEKYEVDPKYQHYPKHIFIPEVIRNNKIKFFKEPKLAPF